MRKSTKSTFKKATPALLIAMAISGGYTSHATASSFQEAMSTGKAGLDLRYRYETVDQEGASETAEASTLRTRLNYATGDYNGFSGFIEFDDVAAMSTVKYNDATGLPSAETGYPVVADPEGTEVNQASLTYKGFSDTTVKVGRQRVILDNARFVGNVGWRQNEQTYDALTVVNKSLADTTVVYGYVNNVNRIFGEASSKGDIDTKTHLLNISYSGLEAVKITGYAYLLDLVDAPTASTSTIGARFSGSTKLSEGVKALYTAEYATQSDYKDGASTIDADYSLLEIGASFSGITAKVGMEVLGANTSAFSTPLATAHAFNGWADKFLGTPTAGLEDTYVSVGTKLAGVKLLGVYHDYSANKGGASYGDEINLLAAKKFGKHYTGLVKYASYSADTHASDTDKLWLMGQAKF